MLRSTTRVSQLDNVRMVQCLHIYVDKVLKYCRIYVWAMLFKLIFITKTNMMSKMTSFKTQFSANNTQLRGYHINESFNQNALIQ